MQVNVLFWGILTDVAQTKKIEVENITELSVLRKQLLEQYPKLAAYSHHIAVNQEIVHEDCFVLQDGDEIALLPPYAGG
ncbi:MAG: MoaD/ThiS family protein [Chitinophagales bacterium]